MTPPRSFRARSSARARLTPLALAIVSLASVSHLGAAPPPISIPASADDAAPTAPGLFGFIDGINRSQTLLGDMWGLRSFLSRYGVSLAVQETSEVLGNTSGGTGQGFKYDGLTQIVMQMDTQRAFDHYGGLFNISVLNVHGDNLSASHLQTLQTASGIEADRSTRLWELWYDQKFLDEDRLDIKVGQQSLDQEFMVSSNALVFVNTMFGWPMLPSADMPGGGPAYPLSALGVRFRAVPVNGVTLLAGVFNGSPVKDDNGSDPQLQDNHGTDFPLGEGTLAIAELQYSYPALGGMVEPGVAEPLGWTYRLGAWYDSESFADQRIGSDGLPLASPQSDGNPLQHKGDWAWYAVADRLVWRDSADPNHTVAAFARVMATPLKDRNLIDRSANLGVVVHSPFTYRTDDTFDVGVGYAHVSRQAALFDIDSIDYGDRPNGAIRNDETFAEVTYQYQLKPWIVLQPDFQYVWRPGAGLPSPTEPSARIKNEVVLGLRANIAL